MIHFFTIDTTKKASIGPKEHQEKTPPDPPDAVTIENSFSLSSDQNNKNDESIIQGLMDSPIPVRRLRNESLPMTTTPKTFHESPGTPSPPLLQGTKNYKTLYRGDEKTLRADETGEQRYLELEGILHF